VGVGNWVGLAVTSFAASLLLATNGFGFAMLAAPFFLLFASPSFAIELVVVLTLAMALTVMPGIWRDIDSRLLLRLILGGVVGVPIGLAAFAYSDPLATRFVIGATTTFSTAMLVVNRYRQGAPLVKLGPGRDIAAGALGGITTGLSGMAGPPVLIYLLLGGASMRTVRATPMAYFALCYAVTLVALLLTVGITPAAWFGAAGLFPLAFVGTLIGLKLGGWLSDHHATALALTVLGVTGLYTLAAAAHTALW
jgi:uncharacterized membrane protein YfcA